MEACQSLNPQHEQCLCQWMHCKKLKAPSSSGQMYLKAPFGENVVWGRAILQFYFKDLKQRCILLTFVWLEKDIALPSKVSIRSCRTVQGIQAHGISYSCILPPPRPCTAGCLMISASIRHSTQRCVHAQAVRHNWFQSTVGAVVFITCLNASLMRRGAKEQSCKYLAKKQCIIS